MQDSVFTFSMSCQALAEDIKFDPVTPKDSREGDISRGHMEVENRTQKGKYLPIASMSVSKLPFPNSVM